MENLPKIPFKSSDIPISEQVIKESCFILGSDSGFYNFLIGTVRSILVHEKYSQIPIIIMDLGLLDTQKNILIAMSGRIQIFNIHEQIKQFIGLDITNPKKMLIYSRIYADKIFNRWRYLFFIDCDGWIHDGFVIDKFLDSAIKQKFAFARTSSCFPCWQNWFPNKGQIITYINIGIYCIDRNFSTFFQEMQNSFHQASYFEGIDEYIICILLNKKFEVLLLDPEDNLLISTTDWPCIHNNQLCLYDPQKYIGFVHLAWDAKNLPEICTTQVINHKMSEFEIENHRAIHKNTGRFPNQISFSTRFQFEQFKRKP